MRLKPLNLKIQGKAGKSTKGIHFKEKELASRDETMHPRSRRAVRREQEERVQ